MYHQEQLVKRPTVAFTAAEHKSIKLHCVENDITIQDFIRKSAVYCLNERVELVI